MLRKREVKREREKKQTAAKRQCIWEEAPVGCLEVTKSAAGEERRRWEAGSAQLGGGSGRPVFISRKS